MTAAIDALRNTPLGARLERLGLTIADVGARGALDADFAPAAWACTMVAFEPEPEEAARLRRAPPAPWRKVTVFQNALGGHDGPGTLHLPDSEVGASLLPHNEEMVERHGYVNLHKTRRTIDVVTVTLDTLAANAEFPKIDYLKLDVEGAELQILRAGTRTLSTCHAIKVECAFLEQRIGQPLAHEVTAFLSGQGFRLADIIEPHRWRRRPVPAHPLRTNYVMPYSRGILAQADLIFLRNVLDVAPAEVDRAMAVWGVLGFFDEAVTLLKSTAATLGRSDIGARVAELADASRIYGRAVSARALRDHARGIYPLARSAVGVMRAPNPDLDY